jgi:hypothetical protein
MRRSSRLRWRKFEGPPLPCSSQFCWGRDGTNAKFGEKLTALSIATPSCHDIGNGIRVLSRCLALTGSRDSTSYGAVVTGEVANGLAQRGICFISWLAHGIDAHARSAALAGHQGMEVGDDRSWLEAWTGTTRQETRISQPRFAPGPLTSLSSRPELPQLGSGSCSRTSNICVWSLCRSAPVESRDRL